MQPAGGGLVERENKDKESATSHLIIESKDNAFPIFMDLCPGITDLQLKDPEREL